MHDFQQVARAHRQVFGRADVEDASITKASATTGTTDAAEATTSSSSSTAVKTSSSSSSSIASTTEKVTATTSSSSATTSASSTTPVLSLSSILGVSSTTSKASSTSSVASSPTTTPSSVSSTAPATSAVTASSAAHSLSTSTATLTSSGTASGASSTSSETSSSSGGLSGAATGGIIAGCILAGLALLIFVIRKTFIQRRKRKRNTWGAGVYPDISDKFSDGASVVDMPPPIPEKTPASPTYLGVGNQPRTPVWAPPRPVSPNPNPNPNPNSYYITPPQASYNNPMMDAAPSLAPPAAGIVGTRPASANSFRPQSAAVETAIVRVLYIPTLPDELSITTGEVVQVVKAYDDGWALCANARGEQGVVPLECLDRTAQSQADRLSVGYGQQESGSDWRNMKRISSLSTQQPHY